MNPRRVSSRFLLLSFILMMAIRTQGLICWVCNAQSHGDCASRGYFLECFSPLVDKVCATEVKSNHGRMEIRKQCKQRSACVNEQNQNWGSESSPGRCRAGRSPSTCRCCCFEDFCNRFEPCQIASRSFCRLVPPMLSSGGVSCSNRNRVGSSCRFTCPSRFEGNDVVLTPATSDMITCLPNGRWNHPIPKCKKPCPPTLRVDLLAMNHRKTETEALERIRRVTKSFIESVNFGEDSLRFARFHFISRVHLPILSFQDTSNITQKQVFKRLDNLIFEEDSGPVNTTRALRFASDNVFGQAGDRSDVKNILVLDTDEIEGDVDVISAARSLRNAGVLIYLAVFPNPNYRVDRQAMYDISGYRSDWRVKASNQHSIAAAVNVMCRSSYPILV